LALGEHSSSPTLMHELQFCVHSFIEAQYVRLIRAMYPMILITILLRARFFQVNFTLLFNVVLAKASVIDKCWMHANLSLLKNELVLSDLSWSEELTTDIEFHFEEIDSLFNVTME